MNFFKTILNCYKKHRDFSGRASRLEFWYFFSYCFLTLFLPATIGGKVGEFILVIAIFLYFINLIPLAAVGARRLHDIGKSGLWLFFIGIPLIGFLGLLFLWSLDGEKKENKYGPFIK